MNIEQALEKSALYHQVADMVDNTSEADIERLERAGQYLFSLGSFRRNVEEKNKEEVLKSFEDYTVLAKAGYVSQGTEPEMLGNILLLSGIVESYAKIIETGTNISLFQGKLVARELHELACAYSGYALRLKGGKSEASEDASGWDASMSLQDLWPN